MISFNKRKTLIRSQGRPLKYPKLHENTSKIFWIKYENKLSLTSKFLLTSFQYKYIYYAIDDILDTLKFHPIERDNLLNILYSSIISLQNDSYINFFDIWIGRVSIEEISKKNRFLKDKSQTLNKLTYIKIELFYKTRMPVKKPEPLW